MTISNPMESRRSRVITAQILAAKDPGWLIESGVAGVTIKYTWQHATFHPYTNRPMLGSYYTVENFTPWNAIERTKNNPLLTAMDDLLKQKQEHKP